jgi:hypothetical protein
LPLWFFFPVAGDRKRLHWNRFYVAYIIPKLSDIFYDLQKDGYFYQELSNPSFASYKFYHR